MAFLIDEHTQYIACRKCKQLLLFESTQTFPQFPEHYLFKYNQISDCFIQILESHSTIEQENHPLYLSMIHPLACRACNNLLGFFPVTAKSGNEQWREIMFLEIQNTCLQRIRDMEIDRQGQVLEFIKGMNKEVNRVNQCLGVQKDIGLYLQFFEQLILKQKENESLLKEIQHQLSN